VTHTGSGDLAPVLGRLADRPCRTERAFCCIARAIFARGPI